MKKSILSSILLFVCFLPFISFPSIVHASTDCHTTQCSSWGYWNGTSYGGITQFTVSGPGFYTSPASWDRFMRLGSGNPKVIVGIFSSVGGGFGNYCSGSGRGLKYGVYGYDSSGFNEDNYCKSVPSSDVNFNVIITVTSLDGYCSSGSSHVKWAFHDFVDDYCLAIPDGNNWNRIQLQEDIHDSISGHQVWGSQWVTNQYISNNGGFVEQTRGEDFLSARNPPQMYWNHEPSMSYPGGQQYSCDYEAPDYLCTLGS